MMNNFSSLWWDVGQIDLFCVMGFHFFFPGDLLSYLLFHLAVF